MNYLTINLCFKDTEQTLGYINSCGGDSNGKQ